MNRVYLDHAATTPTDSKVFAAMKPYFKKKFANPSALYKPAVEVKKDLENSRHNVANILETQPDTVVFTGSATEANNLALLGVARANREFGQHIISVKTEHPSVLNPLKQLEQEGFEVTYLNTDDNGLIDLGDLVNELRTDTILVSIMYVNNEIGTIQDIPNIGRKILKWRKDNNTDFPYLHSDVCQATNYLNLDVRKLHTDLLTLNGSKIYGPKGVGVLYKDREVNIEPVVFGGGQEQNIRSGTENIPGIIGISKGLELVEDKKGEERQRLSNLQSYFWQQLKEDFNNIKLNGPSVNSESRVVNNINISVDEVEGEKLLLYLDSENIYCSTGSACSANKKNKSSIIKEISDGDRSGGNSIRFSMGRSTTKDKIDYTVNKLEEILSKIN